MVLLMDVSVIMWLIILFSRSELSEIQAPLFVTTIVQKSDRLPNYKLFNVAMPISDRIYVEAAPDSTGNGLKLTG